MERGQCITKFIVYIYNLFFHSNSNISMKSVKIFLFFHWKEIKFIYAPFNFLIVVFIKLADEIKKKKYYHSLLKASCTFWAYFNFITINYFCTIKFFEKKNLIFLFNFLQKIYKTFICVLKQQLSLRLTI